MKVHVQVTRSDGFDVNAHFDVDPSQTLALVGPNGAGKTTTLLALAGLIDDGVPVDLGKVGVVFQDGLLFPHLTVRENVGFGSTTDVESLMVELGVEHLAAQKPASLSGGEAQRVALARALASEPDVLLLDEPMSALDATAKGEMRRFLKNRFEAFMGPIVIVTHDPLDAFGLADRVSVMEKGRVVQEGTPTDLRLRPATRYVADLVGTNLLEGTAAVGMVTHRDHDLQVTDVAVSGDVVVQIHPRAVSIHLHRPSGSARNVWQSVVEHVESLGEVARVTFDSPLPLTAEVTTKSVEDLAIRKGVPVYVAIKATEIEVRAR